MNTIPELVTSYQKDNGKLSLQDVADQINNQVDVADYYTKQAIHLWKQGTPPQLPRLAVISQRAHGPLKELIDAIIKVLETERVQA